MRTIRILSVLLPSLLLVAAQPSAAITTEVFQTAEPSLSEPLWQMAVAAGALNAAYAQRLAPAEFREARPAIKVTPEMRGKGAPDALAQIQAAGKAAPGPLAAIGVLPQPVFTDALLNFEGNSANGSAPSDVNGAVGATQYVQWVNSNAGLSIFNKATGAVQLGPISGNTPWAGFVGSPGADACRTSGQGDILAQYDKLAGRWVLSQFAWLNANTNTGPYYQCVAVSTTNDATGTYNRYAFTSLNAAGANVFNDYGKVGVWPDAYYFTYVLFTPLATGNYLGPQVCGYDRAAMLAGLVATAKCKEFGTAFGPLLSSDVDGTTPPPAGSPNFLMGFDFNFAAAGNLLQMWKYSFTTNVLSARTDIPVTPFTIGCPSSFGGACVHQPTISTRLDSLADRPMYRLPYRNYGSREVLVLNHSVQQPGAAANGPLGVRWYELRNPNAAVSVYQQGTYAPDTGSRWMGSVAMDKKGNMALGYSVSSDAVFPGVRYSGRLRSEPSGFLETEASIIAGTGSQTGTGNRWGDYSSMSIDPTDDCTFWYTQQYIASTGGFNWKTRIASFKFKNCTP